MFLILTHILVDSFLQRAKYTLPQNFVSQVLMSMKIADSDITTRANERTLHEILVVAQLNKRNQFMEFEYPLPGSQDYCAFS
jgi:hypothetical protein